MVQASKKKDQPSNNLRETCSSLRQVSNNQKETCNSQRYVRNNQKERVQITFHNPNTMEETAQYLSKIVASILVDQLTSSFCEEPNK